MTNLQEITEEIWREIKNFEGYEVSNKGRVRSLSRIVQTSAGRYGSQKQRTIKGRILKQAVRNGYLFITICSDRKGISKQVHHLVAEFFKGPRPKGLIVLHGDENKQNNNDWNISYGTKAKNTQDYYKSIGKRTGFIPYGDVPAIIKRINSGEDIYVIAKEYSVTRNDVAVINKIITLTGTELEVKQLTTV